MTRWQVAVAAFAGRWVIRLLAWTWRRDRSQRGIYDAARRRADGRPGGIVLALWHGELLPVMIEHGRDPAHAIISQSRDGELIARIAAAFGNRAIRGSSSRGGAEALVRAIQLARDGQMVAVTPDGPRGPRHSVAPGVIRTAQKAEVPLIGIRVHADRAWVMGSWDGFRIPKPFARIRYAYVVVPVAGLDLAAGGAALAAAMREAGARLGLAD